ncbi:adiponectin receptor protein 1 [Pseudozyma hubeiensis SY62]|uniref:Adiponectin receptor protein 1 n=1 Tax=Pseudozyma hubeiensis (strain SY62) TaxID=1305764 RepID=R9P4F0_PSEHS|nr:adiponectin receptor protein 1 [Pseudozyma hubeiensis SY62]GAC96231.1 adiponectin receptor protein 1 [Pseudozyma hubeiensis SY62]
MLGGDLHWLWSPYALYMNVDYIYGLPSWDSKDGFPAAQSLMNVGESIINLFYIYLVHVKATPAALAVAPVYGLVTVIMTLSKTILYVLNDFCCGWCKTGHNDWYTLIVYWILPNGLWILFPSIIAYIFIQELSTSLKVAAGVQGANTSIRSQSDPLLSLSPTSLVASGGESASGDKSEKPLELGPNPYLVDHSQLPSWAQDNAWIVKGYRRPGGAHPDPRLRSFDHGTVYKCWRSVWAYCHNETALPPASNLLTRISSLFTTSFLTSTIPTEPLSNLIVRPPDSIDIFGFTCFFIASIICLAFSATYHTIQCHSFHISKHFNKLDYVGIVVMIVGSFLPALHYGFYCHPHFQLAYSIGISTLGGLAMYTVLAPRYATPAYRPYRTGVFLVLGLSAVIPVAHVIALYGYRTITETMGLSFLILSGALYVVGAGLYAARIPERFAPGRFDLLGASHQIFHVLILAAAIAHYVSIRRAYAFWHTVEATAGEVGRSGVCAALQG